MAKKTGIPEWARRKARAGHFTVSGNPAVTCDAAAKKLYLERRRAVREIDKYIRFHKQGVAKVEAVRPSKRSQTALRMRDYHIQALAEMNALKVKIDGYRG